jgi:hypothetical protein
MLIQGIVQPPATQSLPDSLNPVALTQGKQGDLVVTELHGKYFTQAYRGNLFHYCTPTGGVTLTTSGSTTQTFGILNPPSSGKLIVPTKCRVGFVGATGTVCALQWAFKKNVAADVAGTSQFRTATFVTTTNNANLSNQTGQPGQSGSIARVVSTCTLDAAPTLVRMFGASWGAPLATTAAVFPMLVDEFDGDLILGPGSMLFLAGDTAPGAATELSLTWEEVPV